MKINKERRNVFAVSKLMATVRIKLVFPDILEPVISMDYEMMAATKAAIEYDGPVYILLGRLAIESFNDPETYTFELGKGITLLDGDDVAVIATGLCVNEALKACKQLKEEYSIRSRRE